MQKFVLCCGMLIAASATSQTRPTWQLDSTVDQMSDKKVIWAELLAAHPINYTLGVFTPVLRAICFTEQSDQNPNSNNWVGVGLNFRLVSAAAPAILSVADGAHETYLDDGIAEAAVTMRFDSAKVKEGRYFKMVGGGAMVPEGWLDDQYHSVPGRSVFVPDILNAHRLLIRYTLITDETVTAEFDFGPDTRGAVERVFHACGQQLPN